MGSELRGEREGARRRPTSSGGSLSPGAFVTTTPWPPSMNEYWHARGVRRLLKRDGRPVWRWVPMFYIARAGRLFRRRVALQCRPPHRPFFECRLGCQLALYPPDQRGRDIDNILKGLLDALEHAGIYRNDRQIRRLAMEFLESEPPGRVEVTLWRLE